MRPVLFLSAFLASTVALASSCPQGDAKLQNNTPLTQLCPNGFNGRSAGDIQQAMQTNQDNTRMIVAAAEQQGVPTELALAVSYHESIGFNSCAGSPTGVKGPMQLTQTTARGLGYNRDINEQNIQGGIALLKQAYDRCGLNTTCLAVRYNGADPGQQAQWARGVQSAYNQLSNAPSLVAAACTGGGSCLIGDALPTNTTTQVASNSPAPAAGDINLKGPIG